MGVQKPESVDEAVDVVESFAPRVAAQLVGLPPAEIARLETEFGGLPASLRDYLGAAVPRVPLVLERGGNPLVLLEASALGREQAGYSVDPVTGQRLDDWEDTWFLVASEGGDPVVVDTSSGAVLQAMHGAGVWEFDPIADSMAELVLCGAALHNALTAFESEPILDDDLGFRLAPRAAEWLLPRLRVWAGPHVGHWVGLFDNAV